MAEQHRVTFENVPVLVRVEGQPRAPLALFVHPFPLHGGCWERQIAACAEAGFRAAAVDAPGFGESPPLGRALSMDDLAQIFALSMDALNAPRAVLVGCSMGGYAVMAFHRLFPERLAGGVFMCTRATADSEDQRERREHQASVALTQGAAAVTGSLLPMLIEHQELLPRAHALASGATAQGIADALRGMAERPDSTASLRSWKSPALVIGGEKDQLMNAADIDALAAAIPGARKVVVQDAGHLAFLEQPDEIDELLVTFLHACQEAHAWGRRASDHR